MKSKIRLARCGRRSIHLIAPALLLAGPLGVPGAANFNHDIAPIVYHNCSGCHRPGEAAPFPLLSYADVARKA